MGGIHIDKRRKTGGLRAQTHGAPASWAWTLVWITSLSLRPYQQPGPHQTPEQHQAKQCVVGHTPPPTPSLSLISEPLETTTHKIKHGGGAGIKASAAELRGEVGGFADFASLIFDFLMCGHVGG